MGTLDQMRAGLGRAWESLAEGWQHLRERAAGALTRFRPREGGEIETAEEQAVRRAARWGLLAAEVSEEPDRVIVRLEAPGMEPEDFDVSVVDGYLVVRGEKRFRHVSREGHYHVMECAYGRFERALELPAPVDMGRARARYRRGVLTVELPKTAESRARRIAVQPS